jgi:hypothetical protein
VLHRWVRVGDGHRRPAVTEHLVDEPGQRTRQALDDVLELFRSRLLS